MNKEEMLRRVVELKKDDKQTVYSHQGFEVQILRPSVLSARFRSYNVDKNFQIWLYEVSTGRSFRPNHLRVFIDLNLRVRSNPECKNQLLEAFDRIFYGDDPIIALAELMETDFSHFLNHISIIGVLAQLFIIEQEYSYNRESTYDPPSLFFQGWIREFIDNPKEIDNLCMSATNRQPPQARYAQKENKKSKKFDVLISQKFLWYIDEENK